MQKPLTGLVIILLAACLSSCTGNQASQPSARDSAGLAIATFAGGCFWCVEAGFEQVPGVVSVTSGYTGGHTQDPTYEQVSSGTTGHLEAVEVLYDPEVVTYDSLLQAYWRMVNPTDADGQFADRGPEYATGIWYHSQAQRLAAERSKAALDASERYERPVVTPILPAKRFYAAEDKHQDYYKRHPASYRFYRFFSGRDDYLEKTWGRDLRVDFRKASATADSP